MAYKVISYFTDLTDNGYAYNVGDTYPRAGLEPDSARILELSTDANRRGVALIEEVRAKAEPAEEEAEPVESAPKKRSRKKDD